jgi:hypothetical protein
MIIDSREFWMMSLCNDFRRFACLAFVVGAMPGLAGCDPVRTIEHHVKMTVTDSSRLPVKGVYVSIKESWESWQSRCRETKEFDKAYLRQTWESDFVPWWKGTADDQGKVVVPVKITALDCNRGDTPPANRDTVSNREYLIWLQHQNGVEQLRLVMKPGSTATGKRYSILIEKIEKPQYIRE